MTRRPRPRWRIRRQHKSEQPAELPAAPTTRAMAEAVALIAARAYAGVALDPSGDVPMPELVRALLNVAVVLLGEQFPEDRGAAFLRLLGAEVAGRPGPQ